MPTSKLICFGDLCADIFVQADSFPQPGQDALARQVALLPAGSAANCAVTAARLGVPTQFVGVTGTDELAELLVDDLRQNGVALDDLRRVDAPTAATIAILSGQGERTFFSYRGTNALPYGPLPANLIGPGDCVHLSGYSFQHADSRATALALIQQALAHEAQIALDPSFQFALQFGDPRVLAGLDYIFPNLDEASLLTGSNDPAEAAARLHALGPKNVIVTLGEAGCCVLSDGVNAIIAAYPVPNIVDTTGAGDAFCGGFLAGVLRGLDVQQAARVGQMCAAHVVAALGGHTAAPTLSSLLDFASLHDPALRPALNQLDKPA